MINCLKDMWLLRALNDFKKVDIGNIREKVEDMPTLVFLDPLSKK